MKGTGDGGETKKAATLVIWVVGGLGYISLVGFIIILSQLIAKNKPIPPELLVLLTGLGGGGLAATVATGLLSLLGRTSTDPQHQTVTVDNEKENAVPTDPQGPKQGE